MSFGRCVVCLNIESVGFFLQSFIGGSAGGFRIVPLSDINFRLSVSCKEVGFTVCGMRSYACESFKAYVHLWNPGGPNWLKELQLFHEEEDNSWNLVSRKNRSSCLYAEVVRSSILTGANAVPMGKS